MQDPLSEARSHLRFKPDPLEYALIAVESLDRAFKPDLVALIVEESPIAGCSIIAHDHPGAEVGTECLIKIGDLAPLHATVMWKKPMEPDLMRLGLKFLE